MHKVKLPFWLAVALLAACANPLSRAKTPEQQAYALYAQFVILEEEAAAVMFDPTVNPSIKERIRQADAVAKPYADTLRDAALYVEDVKAKVAAGESGVEDLTIATRELTKALTDANGPIARLGELIGGAQ